jgi:hypothetical protein
MSTFHHVEQKRGKIGAPSHSGEPLSLRQAAAVISGLSLLSWAVVIAIAMAVRALI